MAAPSAPTLSSGQIGNTLREKKKKETNKNKQKASGQKGKRFAKKNILLSPYTSTWPVIPQEIEEKVLDSLTAKFKEFPRLCPERERGHASNAADGIDGKVDSADDDLIRRRLRSQLAIGHRQVSKHLERDQLSLLLVWGGAQPSIITDSLKPLAATRSCPSFCLQKLMPKVMDATGLTSLVALGFKKPQSGLNDFGDFIAMATRLALPLKVPWAAGEESLAEENDDEDSGEERAEESTAEEKKQAAEKTVQPINWPVATESEEQQILDHLTSLLTPYKDMLKTRRKKFQSADWKNKRKTLRSQILTDTAMIRDATRSGKVSLLVMQKDSPLHPLVNASAVSAVENDCPVLCLMHLKEIMSPVLRNPLLAAIAFRKCEEAKRVAEFSDFVTSSSKFASKELKTLLPTKEPAPVGAAFHKDGIVDGANTEKKGTKKPPIPIYNVSHLYVYKTDTEKLKTTKSNSANFISISSSENGARKGKVILKEPTASYLSVSSEPEVTETVRAEGTKLTSAFFDTKGDKSEQKLDGREPQRETDNAGGSSPVTFEGILGMDVVDSPSVSTPFYPEPTKRKEKPALKRKLEKSEAAGDYVSFMFAPTNVQMSSSNPNKVKKNKRRK